MSGIQNVPIRLNKSSYSVSRMVTTNAVDFTNKEVSIYVEPKEVSDEPVPEVKRKTKKTYVKRKRPTPKSWIIENSDGDLFRAVPEQGQESIYYVFTEMNGYFEVSPVDNWYIIRNQMKHMKTQEQIEEEIKSRNRLESKRKDIFKEEKDEDEDKKPKNKAKKEKTEEEDVGESFDYKQVKSDDEAEEEPKSDSEKFSDSDSSPSSSSSSDDEDGDGELGEKKKVKHLLKKGPGIFTQENQIKPDITIKKEPGVENMDIDANLKRKRDEEEPGSEAPSQKRQKRERELTEREVIDILRRHPGITPSGLGKKFPNSINSEDPNVRKDNRLTLKRLISKVAKPQKEQRGDKQRTLLYLKDDIV